MIVSQIFFFFFFFSFELYIYIYILSFLLSFYYYLNLKDSFFFFFYFQCKYTCKFMVINFKIVAARHSFNVILNNDKLGKIFKFNFDIL
jgi:hypothetical protein